LLNRAANNYRVFTDHHAEALRTVRALAAGHGWPRARTILAAVHEGNLRAGGFAFPIIDAAIATMRSDGSLEQALAHLSRRDEQVHHLSLRRLQASAALHSYLARYYSPGGKSAIGTLSA
jgi:DNA-binding transcriptional MerR regulator